MMPEPNRIQQLDETTIGHIAAGEVVERPAQVVKDYWKTALMLEQHTLSSL